MWWSAVCVLHWLLLTVEYQAVIQDRLRHMVGRSLGGFYAHDGILGSQDPEWIQGALNVLIRMF